MLLPLQALVYPLPSHLLRAITELHANQLRAAHAGRKLQRYRCIWVVFLSDAIRC